MLGAPRNTVHLQPYHPVWKSMFERDEAQLQNVIGAYVVDIQHVGSTSIVGLDAKPMIDIAIGVATFDHVDEIASELKTLGYLRLRVKLDGKVVFAKDTDMGRTHYLHLEIYNGVHWNAHLLFRDYLRAHPEVVESYLQLKRELAVQFSDDVKSYTDSKKAFVDAILAQAQKERSESDESMQKKVYPILEFDPATHAMINAAEHIRPIDIPESCVVCFFKDVIDKLVRDGHARVLTELGSESGKNPVYEVNYNGQRVALFHPGVGAPSAAAFLEEVIALGCKKFIACGGAGVLDKHIQVGHIVIPNSAVRDEGTSYHYLEPGREVEADANGVRAIEEVLSAHGVPYIVSKTWTTDAFYRSTPKKVELRKSEGCLTVEMECAAFFAVAMFRNVAFAQLLYGGDDLDSEVWDARDWNKQWDVRERLFWLAVASCIALSASEKI